MQCMLTFTYSEIKKKKNLWKTSVRLSSKKLVYDLHIASHEKKLIYYIIIYLPGVVLCGLYSGLLKCLKSISNDEASQLAHKNIC